MPLSAFSEDRAARQGRSPTAVLFRDRRGVSSVEFAAIATILMFLVLGVMEAGRYLLTIEALRTATADAARLVILRGSANINAGVTPCTNMSGPLSGAAARARFLQANQLTVTLSGCQTDAGVTRVNITATYSVTYNLPLIQGQTRTLSDSTIAVIY